MLGGRRGRREEELDRLDRFRTTRRLVDEDVTALGDQLADLHVETLADELGSEPRHHYRRALELYDQAKHLVSVSDTAEDLLAVEQVVADARWHRAAVVALRDGEALPERREPCFFDPRHGPSMTEVEWTPPGGAGRTVAVCAADARRLAGGEAPAVRLVRVGDRWVPWHEAGGTSAIASPRRAVAQGAYGDGARRVVDQAAVESNARQVAGGTYGM